MVRRIQADVYLVGSVAQMRPEGGHTVAAILFGRRVSTKAFLTDRKAPQVMYKEVWRQRTFGFHLRPAFQVNATGLSRLVEEVCGLPGSKFKLFSDADRDTWKKSGRLRDKFISVSCFADFSSNRHKFSAVDPQQSIM